MIGVQIDDNAATPSPASEGTLRQRVREFIVANFYVADPAALADGTSLLDSGIIDSTGVLEVIAFLERDLGLQVADEEIVPENLDSIERIEAYVRRKRG
jgi:acyl carrier protein